VPHTAEAQADMAKEMGMSAEEVRVRVDQLHEFNPMLGHRGCRLGITYPEIYDMQVEAIILLLLISLNLEKQSFQKS